MLKRVRVVLASVFLIGITLLLLDFTGVLHLYLGWMAKLQLLPAILAVNVAVIVGLAVVTLVFGRVYCSVICPLGIFQDVVSHLGTRKDKRPYHYRKENTWLRDGVWVLFVAALAGGFHFIVTFLAPYSAYGRMVQNLLQPLYLWGNNLLAWASERLGSYAFYPQEVWIRSLPTLIVAIVTLVVIVVLSFKGGRTYCNSICPVGTTLGFLSRFSLFAPVINLDKCKNCRACEFKCKAHCIDIDNHQIDYSRCVDCFNCIESCRFGALKYRFAWGKSYAGRSAAHAGTDKGRRAFMAGTAVAAGTLAAQKLSAQGKKLDGGFAEVLPKQAPERSVPITPPGSRSVRDFYKRCTGCQLCVAECPNQVLRPSSDLDHFMQPQLSYEKGYCRPECTRCSELCPTGAIRKITREEKTLYHVGTAGVNPELCLSATGKSPCGKCSRSCPVGAIQMVTDPLTGNSRPVVAEEICIGCGACEQLCPVRPVSAITVNGRYEHMEA